MAAYWTIKKDEDEEDIKTINPFQEAMVKGNMAQYPPEDEDLDREQCAQKLNEYLNQEE